MSRSRASRFPSSAWLGLLVFAAAMAKAPSAAAYCRTTTTCDFCVDDPKPSCPDSGIPLFWGQSCVSFSVQKDGSQYASYQLIQKFATQAFLSWQLADCGGSSPSIVVDDAFGPAVCHRHEYNIGQGNANIIMLYDHDFPFPNTAALAVTTVIFNNDTGEIYDADMEIDTSDPISKPISVEATPVPGFYDLLSIMTHESGHFLGLAHAQADESVMHEIAELGGDLRQIKSDDVKAICAVYPPDRPFGKCDFTPRHGFSPDCAMESSYARGCAIDPGGARMPPVAPLAMLGLLAAGFARARSRARRGPDQKVMRGPA